MVSHCTIFGQDAEMSMEVVNIAFLVTECSYFNELFELSVWQAGSVRGDVGVSATIWQRQMLIAIFWHEFLTLR